MVLIIEEYTTLLQLDVSNPNKGFWKKTKGVGFVKKISQIMGLDMTTIDRMKSMKGKS